MEGGSIEVNGAGCVLTTRQCLLSPRRNPSLSEAEIEAALAAYLGTPRVLWLDTGLEGDHTDGHIDTITRFTDARTIVTVTCEDRADPNYDPTRAEPGAAARLQRCVTDQPFRIVELPLPRTRAEFGGERLPLTYANFYVVNGAVIVPVYGDTNDARALDILRPLFPGREVRGVMARHLITGGGAFHCVTQQQPAGVVTERHHDHTHAHHRGRADGDDGPLSNKRGARDRASCARRRIAARGSSCSPSCSRTCTGARCSASRTSPTRIRSKGTRSCRSSARSPASWASSCPSASSSGAARPTTTASP